MKLTIYNFKTELDAFQLNIESIIADLISKKGEQEPLAYFESTFHIYMASIVPKANQLVKTYSGHLSHSKASRLKELVQKQVEKGFEIYFQKLTNSGECKD